MQNKFYIIVKQNKETQNCISMVLLYGILSNNYKNGVERKKN